MKKRIMALVLAGAMALSMGVTAFAEEADDISIAFVMHAQNGSFYTKLSDGAEAAAADLGITVNVSAPNTASSLQDQISLLETAVASDVDGIATVTWDLSGFNGIIAEAAEKGIPVIGFNQDAEGCGTVAFVGQAYEEAGYSLGKYMFDLMGGEGKYIIASCGPTDSALIAREAGIDRAAAEYDGVEKLETIDIGTDLTNAYGVIENALLAHPDCTAVLGVDVFSEAIGNVIEDQGLEGQVYAAGFDLTEGMLGHIKNGSVQLTVGQNPFLQGYYSVLELYLNKKYGSDFLNIDTGAQMVTSENVDTVQPE